MLCDLQMGSHWGQFINFYFFYISHPSFIKTFLYYSHEGFVVFLNIKPALFLLGF